MVQKRTAHPTALSVHKKWVGKQPLSVYAFGRFAGGPYESMLRAMPSILLLLYDMALL